MPACLTILAKGHTVEMTEPNRSLLASKDGHSHHAHDPIFLLGLIPVGEMRGENWQATDARGNRFGQVGACESAEASPLAPRFPDFIARFETDDPGVEDPNDASTATHA